MIMFLFPGKPPFFCDNCTDLKEMILHQELPPLRETSNVNFITHMQIFIYSIFIFSLFKVISKRIVSDYCGKVSSNLPVSGSDRQCLSK